MDKTKVLEYLKKQARPVALGEIAAALGLEHAQAAQLLQRLSRENLAFRSVKDGHAFYSADPTEGEGAIPTQAFIDGIQGRLQGVLGGSGMKAQSVTGNTSTDVLLSVNNGGSEADDQASDKPSIADFLNNIRDGMTGGELPPESPVHWTFDKGLMFENDQYSLPIPDGFRFVDDPTRAFMAVPESHGEGEEAGTAEVQIMDSNLMGGAIGHPVLADSEVYPALVGSMGYTLAEQMRAKMAGNPLMSLTGDNDIRLKLDGAANVLSIQTLMGYSHMVMTMTCDGMKSIRVQTQHTPSGEVEREQEALLGWIKSLKWKHEMPRQPLNDPALVESGKAWLEALNKKLGQMNTVRQMAVQNEVNGRGGHFADEADFEQVIRGAVATIEPVFRRTFGEIADALSQVHDPDLKEIRKILDIALEWFPVKVGSNVIASEVVIQADDATREVMERMNGALKALEQEESARKEAERRAREQRKAEEHARRRAEEQAKREQQLSQAKAEAKRRAELEQADREKYQAFLSRYEQVKVNCRAEREAISKRLNERSAELNSLGFFKFSAKKEAKADVERITAELNAFPQKERQTLGQVWPQAEAELREAVCRVLVLDYIKAHPLSQQGIILSQGMGEKEYASFGVSDANRALEQLTRDKRIVHLEEGYRCLKDDETAKAVLQAERERKEQERRRAEAAAAERERQKKEDLPLCADILNILVDGEAHSIGEILQEVNKMRKQFKLPDYSFADVQRALGWMKEDKQVAYGRPQYASRNRMGYYMI